MRAYNRFDTKFLPCVNVQRSVGFTLKWQCDDLTLHAGNRIRERAGFPSSRESRWSATKCQAFFPPPLPPPMFPPLKHKAELMVDITEYITGPKGEKGCRGPRGPQGEPGVKGPDGEVGRVGTMGQTGEEGEKGDRGWRGLYGDIGTPGMIKGSKGQKGFKGNKGLKGDRGLSGEMGDRGIAGEPGEKGDWGQLGKPGLRGELGPRGKTADRGTMGSKGSRGPTGKQGHLGQVGRPGLNGQPGRPGQVYVLSGLLGDTGSQGPSATCNCSQVRTRQQQWDNVQSIFIADGERQMRRLRGQNVMVLRTDRQALYIYAESQWINVLDPRH
ncbi:acetylcholinesterase collagenic tail peptide-like [Scomber scombrus]|uniref:Acetylcholinesterase collagenic tail peptide-like n=1 Tax=Scomber scombrus TaxID=13677 RepID=A0AAV1P7M5_SCOSC